MSILVYRLEHKETGLGPFYHHEKGLSVTYCIKRHLSPCDQKNFSPDEWDTFVKKHGYSNMRFSWNSLEKLYGFIRKDGLSTLKKYGFVIVCYRVSSPLCYTDGQRVFDKTTAIKVWEL